MVSCSVIPGDEVFLGAWNELRNELLALFARNPMIWPSWAHRSRGSHARQTERTAHESTHLPTRKSRKAPRIERPAVAPQEKREMRTSRSILRPHHESH